MPCPDPSEKSCVTEFTHFYRSSTSSNFVSREFLNIERDKECCRRSTYFNRKSLNSGAQSDITQLSTVEHKVNPETIVQKLCRFNLLIDLIQNHTYHIRKRIWRDYPIYEVGAGCEWNVFKTENICHTTQMIVYLEMHGVVWR